MKKRLITIISGLIFAFTSTSLYAWRGGSGGCDYSGFMGQQWFGNFYGGGMFMGILTLVLIALLIFFGINYFRKGGVLPGGKESPLEILKIRYAKGEINKEEFEAMKREIGE
jgi:putative membrane protein